MKEIMFCAILAIALTPADAQFQNYEEHDVLTVVANSGLRMRVNPEMSSPTIKVLEHGTPVTVLKTNGYDGQYTDRIQWMDGSWVKVKTGHLSGWLFDGFLTTLPPVQEVDHLCLDCYSLTTPLIQYLQSTIPVECEWTDTTEDVSTTDLLYSDGIYHHMSQGDGWYRHEIVFDQLRMSEVVNLLRSMLVGKQMRQEFEESLVFHEDRNGFVSKIEVKLFPDSLVIEQEPEGLITMTAMVLIPDFTVYNE